MVLRRGGGFEKRERKRKRKEKNDNLDILLMNKIIIFFLKSVVK